MSEKKTYIKTYGNAVCSTCGKEFEKFRCNQVYCCKDCKYEHDKKVQTEYSRRRYNEDPEYREMVQGYRKKWYEKKKAENA